MGSFQSSPVIYDGLKYITTACSTHAVDPVTCAKRWTHAYLDRSSTRITLSRGPALYKGKLFRITPNGHLLALDAKTGTLLWDVLMTDSSLGYWLSGAPVAYDGRVFIGEAGGDSGVNCHIYAFDGESGRWLWTFDTIPTGKQFGADSWKMGSEHGGGSSWSTFALDPVKGLLYASVGNPAPDFHGDVRPGDNLFTDSVVALDYKTGRLNWYAQQVPHDVHDWDTAAAPMLYVQDGRRFMAVASKDGYSYLYDRDSHRLVAKTEVSRHENVDVPLTVQGVHHCPGIVGGVEWNGLAYSPVDRLTFVNSVDYCATTTLQDLNFQVNSSYMGGKVTWDPISQARGFTYGLDGATGKVVWTHESQSPMIAGVTPTAGGVVFTGSIDGDFLVLNSKTGASLYRFNTGGAVAGGVSTYSVNGVQYVAVTSGNASKAAWQSSGAGMVVVFGLPPR